MFIGNFSLTLTTHAQPAFLYFLATGQVNIGRITGLDMNDPVMADFVGLLDEINALAESSPGFVWRLNEENNNATALRPYADERIILNMSVWKSVETLEAIAYRTAHATALRRRKEWFQKMDTPFMALWYVPAGHIPSVEEAKIKLALLEKQGPYAKAFTFRVRFDPPLSVNNKPV